MPVIEDITAIEILDSRGRPTVSATCRLAGGAAATVSVPSGASTGKAEAIELRDGDNSRYRGMGCRRAVANINNELNRELRGRRFEDQSQLDQTMLDLDGTPNKSRLGANAILAVSLAFTRAAAVRRGIPLYQQFADLINRSPRTLPRLTVNLFSGGKHAGGQVAIQDVLIVPMSAMSIDDSLAMIFAIYQSAAELAQRKYGARALTADEGGLAPPFADTEAMLTDAVEAISLAGFQPGKDAALAVDVASSHFYRDGLYQLDQSYLTSRQMIARMEQWIKRYPIISIEDGLAEEDWANWPALRSAIGSRALVVGDDLLCTNPERIQRAIDAKAATALLLKVNQIGTVSEAAKACEMARAAGWAVTMSARSGETEDYWLADLAVGWSCGQIKVGSITQSERLAKYNRLLVIEAETNLPLIGWPGR